MATVSDTRKHAERRLSPLQRRALDQRHAAAVPLLKHATEDERYRLFEIVVWPDPDLERAPLEQLEREDAEPD